MVKYRFEQIAINSTEKKKPVEEDRFTYLGRRTIPCAEKIPSNGAMATFFW